MLAKCDSPLDNEVADAALTQHSLYCPRHPGSWFDLERIIVKLTRSIDW